MEKGLRLKAWDKGGERRPLNICVLKWLARPINWANIHIQGPHYRDKILILSNMGAITQSLFNFYNQESQHWGYRCLSY
jgi:hypothetical protein